VFKGNLDIKLKKNIYYMKKYREWEHMLLISDLYKF